MSKIKELKTNTNFILNLVDVVELFVPDKKSKYTDLILRLMTQTEDIDEYSTEVKDSLIKSFNFLDKKELDKFSSIQIILFNKFIESHFHQDDLIVLRKFCDFNERGLISQNDLSQYKSFEQINEQVSLGELKVVSKQLEKEIVKVYDTDEWLLVRPLTYLASKKYGSNTKWCTTSSDTADYFRKYSKKGILIYCINRLTGYKVASFYSLDKSDPEFSFWNQQDLRIDSLDTELNDELRLIIRNVSKDPLAKSNRELLPKELHSKEDKYRLNQQVGRVIGIEPEPTELEPVEEIMTEEPTVSPRTRRISEALRRVEDSYLGNEEPMDYPESESAVERGPQY